MKTILLPIEIHRVAENAIDTAVQLAQAFDSYVEGFALAADTPLLVSADAFSGAMIAADPSQPATGDDVSSCRSFFEHRMAACGLHRFSEGIAGPSFGWLENDSARGRRFLGSYGRVCDVTVIPRPESGSDGARFDTVEAALFETGRPVLIAPPVASGTLGENVLIAWNGTPEVARTIAFAKPLLHRARQVSIVTVAGGQTPGPSGEHLRRHLRMHGISCEAYEVELEADSRGATFLAEAARRGSDLIIKGAYTQSRLRQMIFGGATRHIVTEASLPVFMAH